MVRGPLVGDGLTNHHVRWWRGESQMGIGRVAEGGCNNQDGQRRDAKSAADENQIPSVARPLLLGRRLSLRLSELFDVVCVFCPCQTIGRRRRGAPILSAASRSSWLVRTGAQIATIAR